jgi:hypothetical protein
MSFMLSVLYNPYMLSVIMLNVIMLCVVMLSVAVPCETGLEGSVCVHVEIFFCALKRSILTLFHTRPTAQPPLLQLKTSKEL